eukprot:gi/632969663/ref/XP_007901203.1/ PREDICTED: uncharacterized protein KIAA0040 homolog [Callorhinchus milii]
MLDEVYVFLSSCWKLLQQRHSEGLYNSVCLALLLLLPLLMLLVIVFLCCQACWSQSACCSPRPRRPHPQKKPTRFLDSASNGFSAAVLIRALLHHYSTCTDF